MHENHYFKKGILLLSVLLLGITGCGKEEVEETEHKSTNKLITEDAANSYMEEEIGLAPDLYSIGDMRCSTDGRVIILGKDRQGSVTTVLKMNMEDRSVEVLADIREKLKLGEKDYCEAYILSTGEVFCEVARDIEDMDEIFTKKPTYYLLGSTYTVKELALELPELSKQQSDSFIETYLLEEGSDSLVENGVMAFDNIADNQLAVLDYKGDLYEMNKDTGEISKNYKLNERLDYPTGLLVTGNEIVIQSNMDSAVVDMQSGELMEKSGWKDILDEIQTLAKSSTGQYPFILRGDPLKNIYYCLSGMGMYQIREENGTLSGSLLMESAGTALYDTSLSTNAIAVPDKDKFLLAMQDNTTGKSRLFCYTKGDTTVKEEFKVWALKESNDVRNAVSMYQSKYPDTKVNVEIGMPPESTLTISDAVRNLNTQLLSGEGPDVMFLDQISVDTYIEKDMLADLTEVVNEVKEKDGIFENIAQTFQKDGKIMAIPSRFVAMMLSGSKENIEIAKDIEQAAEKQIAYNAQYPDKNFLTTRFDVLSNFYYTAMFQNNKNSGTMEKEELIKYFESLKKIYDSYNENDYPVKFFKGILEVYAVNTYDEVDPKTGAFGVANGYFYDAYPIADIRSIKANINPELENEFLEYNGKSIYIPAGIVAVNSKSKFPVQAKEYIRCVLSEEMESKDTGSGVAINRKAFENSTKFAPVDWDEYAVDPYTDAERDSIITAIEKLDTPAAVDGIIFGEVQQQLESFLNGEKSAESAASEVIQKVELYQEE